MLTHHFLFITADEVEFLLIVCNDNERDAVKGFLKRSREHLVASNHTVTLGVFGGHKVALFYTAMGNQCYEPVVDILLGLTNVDKVLAIGVAYGADEMKQKLGDVVVSTRIEVGT